MNLTFKSKFPALSIVCLAMLGALPVALGGDHATPLITTPVEDDGWKFNFELNLWAPDLTATASDGSATTLGVDDIIDDFQSGAMLSLDARKDRWILGADLIYMDLEQDFSGALGPASVSGDVELTGVIATAAVGYRVLEREWGHVNLLAGARYLYLDVEADAILSDPGLGSTPVSTSESGSDWAGIVGFEGHYDLTSKWFIPFYFDIGTGEPDLTYQAFLGIGYRTKYCDIALGYRYLKFEFDSGSALSELEAKGPMVGVNFAF